MPTRTLPGMHSSDLTIEQVHALQLKLAQMTKFMQGLIARCDQLKFQQLDPLRMQVVYTLDRLEAFQKVLQQMAKQREFHDRCMFGLKGGHKAREADRQRKER